ncbi:hypothetical protein [Streptomyces sp. NPDC051665]|uniref:hypothetical protein n=1 Tax=Streptomyces sp. NPDC051665 TaxID=3154647 RepID=UPI003412D052
MLVYVDVGHVASPAKAFSVLRTSSDPRMSRLAVSTSTPCGRPSSKEGATSRIVRQRNSGPRHNVPGAVRSTACAATTASTASRRSGRQFARQTRQHLVRQGDLGVVVGGGGDIAVGQRPSVCDDLGHQWFLPMSCHV